MELGLIVVGVIVLLVVGFAAWMVFQVQQANGQRDRALEETAALVKKLAAVQAALDQTNAVLLSERTTHGEQVARLQEVASARLADLTRMEVELASRDAAGGGARLRELLSSGGAPNGAPAASTTPWGGGLPGRTPAKP